MPKLVTVKKTGIERQQAVRYIKNSFVYPSALIGLVCLVVGYGAVIYLMIRGRPMEGLLTHSLFLLAVGLALGLLQAIYQHYLFRAHPGYFAERVRQNDLRLSGRFKKIGLPPTVEHSFRWAVPIAYLAAASAASYSIILWYPNVNLLSAVLLVLAGFHNIRFFYMKRLVK